MFGLAGGFGGLALDVWGRGECWICAEVVELGAEEGVLGRQVGLQGRDVCELGGEVLAG